MSWVVRFVDKPETGRVTRLDLQSGEAPGQVMVQAEGFSTGQADLLRALTGSMLTDGEAETASARTNRTVTVPLRVYGDGGDFSAAMNLIAREIDRQTNWLEFQPDGVADSIFFECLRGEVAEVGFEDSGAGIWWVTVELLCKPCAVGLPETGVVPGLSNDPATGQVFTMPAVKGDVSTPLRVQATWTSSDFASKTLLVNTHAHAASSRRQVIQAESAALLTNSTTLQANDSAMSGAGGNNFVRTAFGTATLTSRLWFTSPQLAGRYKVLVRVRKSAASDVFTLQWQYQTVANGSAGLSVVSGAVKTYPVTTQTGPHWVDLGSLSLPAFGLGLQDGSAISGDFIIRAGRTAGSGTLDYDCVVLVPSEVPDSPAATTGRVHLSSAGIASTVTGVVWDSERLGHITLRAGLAGWTSPRPGGGFPHVHPGWHNFVTLMRHVGTLGNAGGTTGADSLTDTTDIAWSYRPRYLYVGAP